MSLTQLVPVHTLALLGSNDDEISKAMRWLEMASNTNTEGSTTFSLRIDNDTNDFVRQVKNPFNLISVMGPARSGKSTLMNLLAGMKKSELFTTNPGMETFTKGVFIPTRVLSLPEFSSLENEPVVEAIDSNIKVSFVDTEGQGAIGASYDMNLFSSALVASKVIIYNRTGGLLTEDILNQLGMMTQAAQRLRVANNDSTTNGDPSAPKAAVFGHLCIVFNQFRLGGKDTADGLMSKLMKEEPDTGPNSKNRNTIRKHLIESFESIRVFILPDDLKPEARDALNDGTKPFLLLDDFGPKYLEYFKVLRTGLSKSLVSPLEMVKGLPITGAAMADFMPKFVEAINKAEPLNVPGIFEAGQNDAINKALAAFNQALAAQNDIYLKEEAKPTNLLSGLFDKDVLILLAALAVKLSYMPPDIVKRAQSDAQKSAEDVKTSLLSINMTRLQALVSNILNAEAQTISNDLDKVFPPDNQLIAQTEVDKRFDILLTSHLSAFKARVESYDARALPPTYQTVITDAVNAQKKAVISRITTAWRGWISSLTEKSLTDLSAQFVELLKNTPAGDDTSYISSETTIVSAILTGFNKTVDQGYLLTDIEAQKDAFKVRVEEMRSVRRATFEKNEATIKQNLQRLVKRLQGKYSLQLENSLTPNVEPDSYEKSTSAVSATTELAKFFEMNNLDEQLKQDTLLDFDSFVASEKGKYKPIYVQASNDYQAYLIAELGRQVPLLTSKYVDSIDAIALEINSTASTKTSVATACQAKIDTTLSEFDTILTSLRIQPGGLISKSIVDTSRAQLIRDLNNGKTSKLAKYDEVVAAYNKALLTTIIVPIVDQALANKFASESDLRSEVDKGKANFDQKSAGEKDTSGDAATKWKAFMDRTYPTLVENVKAFNGFNVSGLDSQSAGTVDVQKWVVKNIWSYCANLAGSLNMSYINSAQFSPDKIIVGEATRDQSKPDSQPDRTFKLINQYSDSNSFDWERKTNLEWFGWEFEVSDIIFGKPIITDLKPVKIDSSEFPLSTTPMTIQVGTRSIESTVISNSFTQSYGFELGTGYKWGQKDEWEANLSAKFNAKFDIVKSNATTSSYETSTQATIILPPNRTNVVHQMIFDQRTSLPYTAKIRLIPRLRFQNGFSAWGGGGSYTTNPRTGALKDNQKSGDRTYKDFEFPRCDAIRDQARSNADPWDWDHWKSYNPWATAAYLDPLADPKSYEVYVKGKWEGITGKYAVTTVTPKTTNLTLMPDI